MKKMFAVCAVAMLIAGAAYAEEAGETLYKEACGSCHGVDGAKSAGGTVPLKDQSGEVILEKLKGYAAGTYGGEKKNVMVNVVKKYQEGDLKKVADYAGTL